MRAGKINYVGLSNFTGWQVQKAAGTADARGLSVPVSLQPQYSLLARAIEWEIVPACQDAGLGLLAWSPLGRAGSPAIPARRAARPGHPGGRERRRGHADLEPARRLRADLAGPRRGPQGRRGPRRVHGPGGDRLGAGPPRGQRGDPRARSLEQFTDNLAPQACSSATRRCGCWTRRASRPSPITPTANPASPGAPAASAAAGSKGSGQAHRAAEPGCEPAAVSGPQYQP